jgi:hypothetical protein
MAQPGNLEILWEGNLPLENIKWGKISPTIVNLPNVSQLEIKSNWKEHLKHNPKDYDGNLLFIKEFKQKGKNVILNISTISFSTVIYLVKNNLKLTISIGILGVQYLVFSPIENIY